MNTPVIVVLSKYPDIFDGFRESVDRDAPEVEKLVYWDEMEAKNLVQYKGWRTWISLRAFQMARNANQAWRAAEGSDLLYAGDDTRIIEPDTIKRLQAVAYSDPAIGIVSPRIKDQDAKHEGEIEIVPFVTFPMVYIKAEVIERVGYLDESFEGYGFEDVDYCVRVRRAGFKLAYANQVRIQHGLDGRRFGSTFFRTIGQERIESDMNANLKRFAAKWGIEPTPQAVWEFVRGDEQRNLPAAV